MTRTRTNLALMSALVLASASMAHLPSGVTRTSARQPRPRRVQLDEEVADARKREIAAWNEAVERRKAEKKLGRSA